MAGPTNNSFYRAVKGNTHAYNAEQIAELLNLVDETRVTTLAGLLKMYISSNLPTAINSRTGLAAYRTNPYVLLTSASVMHLTEPSDFAAFLFNNKLYAGLETSFGKSIENTVVGQYPIGAQGVGWTDPPEKLAEFAALGGLLVEDRAQQRNQSVWREIDRSCVVGNRRYLTTIKSGPNCINDTQVEGMKSAIVNHHATWMRQTQENYPGVTDLDIVIGLTYGTDRTTNNKENQILVKLLAKGFAEENREEHPGVLVDPTGHIRVYRQIGQDFWSFIGNPANPTSTPFVFLEVLLALAKALSEVVGSATLEEQINAKLLQLSNALRSMMFPRNSLPQWVREDFSQDELFWLATALSAFYDEGI